MKFLDFRCQQYTSIKELYETLQEVRDVTPVTKRVMGEVIIAAPTYRLPGWGQKANHFDLDYIFEESNSGLAILSYLREMLQGTTRYSTKEDLTKAAHAIHEAMVERRKLDLENIRLWLRLEKGEPCKLWNVEGKRIVSSITMKDVRDLFRIYNSSSGTVALLRCLQLEGKQYSKMKDLINRANFFAEENQNQILKHFIEKRNDIFRPFPPEINFEITLADIVLLCEEGRAGPATLNYIPQLCEGSLRYSTFEEIYGVIKKLHAPHRNPFRIL